MIMNLNKKDVLKLIFPQSTAHIFAGIYM